MRPVVPHVYLISRPSFDWPEIMRYLEAVGGQEWGQRIADLQGEVSHGETLIEFMGRMCYRSWAPGLNPNVTKVRQDKEAYLRNIIESAHGSVLEHANYGFVFHNVSRVFTHELVRHRAGTAISQESMRYVRLDDIPFEHPEFVQKTKSPRVRNAAEAVLAASEHFMKVATEEMHLDDPSLPFHEKKVITSAMRRYAPDGVATSIGWTANVRAIRHVLEVRTSLGAEEEIRRVFDSVGLLIRQEVPSLFVDFQRDENGVWSTTNHKV